MSVLSLPVEQRRRQNVKLFFFLKHLVTVVALISETDVFTKSSEPQRTLN